MIGLSKVLKNLLLRVLKASHGIPFSLGGLLEDATGFNHGIQEFFKDGLGGLGAIADVLYPLGVELFAGVVPNLVGVLPVPSRRLFALGLRFEGRQFLLGTGKFPGSRLVTVGEFYFTVEVRGNRFPLGGGRSRRGRIRVFFTHCLLSS